MNIAAAFIFFILGLCVGSFLNVLIYRLPKEESISGRSYCPSCKKKLTWQELFPVLSFIFLSAKCSKCKKKISFQYPLIEIITGALFVFVFAQLPSYFLIFSENSLLANIFTIFLVVCLLSTISILLVVFVTDFKYMIVPDKIVYPAMGFALFYQLFKISSENFIREGEIKIFDFEPLGYAILAGLAASLFFFSLVVITKGKGMGLGDVKVAAFMGFFLGPPNILVALFLAFLSGSIIGLAIVFAKRKKLKGQVVPFVCFLAPATFIAFFWGEEIINYYFDIMIGEI